MLEAKCKHRRYGTMVHHKNCNIVKAFLSALGENTSTHMDSSTHNNKDIQDKCNHTLAQQLHTAALYEHYNKVLPLAQVKVEQFCYILILKALVFQYNSQPGDH